MNPNKICFIICTNDEESFDECVRYLQMQEPVEGMAVEILEIKQAVSMTSGYNEGMRSSDAKYKIYMHQDVFLIYRWALQDIIALFRADEKIGMIGLVGILKMPANGVMWHGQRVGFLEMACRNWEEYRYQPDDGFWRVEAIDGLLMATQYDLPWREDMFDGWDFYDCSQSYEMRRAGYDIAVPFQKKLWCVHDDGPCLNLWNYDKYRKLFLSEYMEREIDS